jgi:hypothetical protein
MLSDLLGGEIYRVEGETTQLPRPTVRCYGGCSGDNPWLVVRADEREAGPNLNHLAVDVDNRLSRIGRDGDEDGSPAEEQSVDIQASGVVRAAAPAFRLKCEVREGLPE